MGRSVALLVVALLPACSFDWSSFDPRLGETTTSTSGSAVSTTSAGGGETGQGGAGAGGQGGDAGSGGEVRGPWEEPEPVAAFVHAADDDDPSMTEDGLEVYFNSDRGSTNDIYVSKRMSIDDPWDPPVRENILSSDSNDQNGTVSPDGRTYWFLTTQGGNGYFEIYISTRANRDDDWSMPVLSTDLSLVGSSAGDVGGTTRDGLLMIIGRDNDLHHRSRMNVNDPWSDPDDTLLLNINGPAGDSEAWLGPLGVTLFFNSSRDGSVENIYVTTRGSLTAAWAAPTLVTEVNSGDGDSDPTLTGNQRYMMFARELTGEGREIYETRR